MSISAGSATRGPKPLGQVVLEDGHEAHALVQHLLDLVQHGLALLAVGLDLLPVGGQRPRTVSPRESAAVAWRSSCVQNSSGSPSASEANTSAVAT